MDQNLELGKVEMRSIWHSLAFKEWHEHKWKLASLAAILLAVHGYILVECTRHGFEGLITSDDAPITLVITFYFCALPGALFIGMGVAAGERSSGTMEFLTALPVRPWRVAVAKLCAGCSVIVISVAATTLLMLTWLLVTDLLGIPLDRGRSSFAAQPYWTTISAGLITMVCAVQVLLWCAAAGTNRTTEIRAGAAGIAVLVALGVIIWIVELGTQLFAGNAWDWPRPSAIPIWASPAGINTLGYPHSPDWFVILLQFTAAGCLVAWCVGRFGRVTVPPTDAAIAPMPTVVGVKPGILPARHSTWNALAWKQFRESVPFFLIGLVVILGVALLLAATFLLEDRSRNSSLAIFVEIPNVLRGCFEGFGVLVALVVGIGTFVADLQPQRLAFWRSRPISVSQWFWIKFVTSAVAIVACLQGPVLMAHGCTLLVLDDAAVFWRENYSLGTVWDVYLFVMPLVHLTVFSIAVCITCLVRQTVYAGILAFGAVLSLVLLPQVQPSCAWLSMDHALSSLESTYGGDWSAWWSGFFLPFTSVTSILFFSTAVIAWQAVQRDWGSRG